MNIFGGNLQELFEQARRMQEDVARLQSELESKTVEASSGGGMVTATVTGAGLLKKIAIDRTVVDANDIEMLQDLIVAAVNEGVRKSKELAKEELGRATSGITLPPFLQGFLQK